MKNDKEKEIIKIIKELVANNLTNKELSINIDKYFIPHESEKETNAEVSTPYKLRQEMLDKIPKSFWKKEKKVFEPCCGKGGFLVDIIGRFMKGLKNKIVDEKTRYKVIVEKCLYWSDINPTNIFICKLLVDPYNKYKLNYNEGNTLELDITKTTKCWKGLDGFDLHVCNPPYENNTINGRKALNNNLWSEFLTWSYDRLNKNGFMLYITPTSWMSPSSKNKEMFYNNHILYLNVNECKKHFNVGSTFSYYLIKKTKVIDKTIVECEYNKKVYKSICNLHGMKYLPKFITNETLNIIKKFMNNKLEKISFGRQTKYHSANIKGFFDKKSSVFKYEFLHTKKSNRFCKEKHPEQNNQKILLNISGNLNPFYDNGKYGFTESQMYLLTNKKKYINILNSKLYNFIFTICKWSGFNNEKMYHDIPFITENKTDDELYKIFNLTKQEIKLIENSI